MARKIKKSDAGYGRFVLLVLLGAAVVAVPVGWRLTAQTGASAACGNRILETGEECEDGNVVNADGCSAACKTERCGDGVRQEARQEECDDGNYRSGDGCNFRCQEERCGDGVIQPLRGETCDDGNTANGDACPSSCIAQTVAPAPAPAASATPNVAVTMTVPATIQQGQPLIATVNVRNTGTVSIQYATAAFTFPSSLPVTAATVQGTGCQPLGPGAIVCQNFPIAAGETKIFVFRLTPSVAQAPACNTAIFTHASVAEGLPNVPPNQADNVAEGSTTVTCAGTGEPLLPAAPPAASTAPNVAVTLDAPKEASSPLKFSANLKVRNTGTVAVPSAKIEFQWEFGKPLNIAITQGAGCYFVGMGKAVCEGITLSPGQEKIFTFEITQSTATCGALTFNATAWENMNGVSVSQEDNKATASVNVSCLAPATPAKPSADMQIFSQVAGTTMRQGLPQQYRFSVWNAPYGSSVELEYPTNISGFGAATFNPLSQNCRIASPGLVRCAFETINNPTTVFIDTIPVTAPCGTVITVKAKILSQNVTDPNPSNNVAESRRMVDCPVQAPPPALPTAPPAPVAPPATNPAQSVDLSVALAGPSSVTRGGTVALSVTGTTSGPGTTYNSSYTLEIPQGLSFVSTTSTRCVLQGNVLSCSYPTGTYAVGSTGAFSVTLRAAATTACNTVLTPTVQIASSNTTDPRTDNNRGQKSVTITCAQTAPPTPPPAPPVAPPPVQPPTASCTQQFEYTITTGQNFSPTATPKCSQNTPGAGWILVDRVCNSGLSYDSPPRCVSDLCLWKKPATGRGNQTLSVVDSNAYRPLLTNSVATCAPHAGNAAKAEACLLFQGNPCTIKACFYESAGAPKDLRLTALDLRSYPPSGALATRCTDVTPPQGYSRADVQEVCLQNSYVYTGTQHVPRCLQKACLWRKACTPTQTPPPVTVSPQPPTAARCGDGICSAGEYSGGTDFINPSAPPPPPGMCNQDCGEIFPLRPFTCPLCGDNKCENQETAQNCPGDCATRARVNVTYNAECRLRCGDNYCYRYGGETTANCPADCRP